MWTFATQCFSGPGEGNSWFCLHPVSGTRQTQVNEADPAAVQPGLSAGEMWAALELFILAWAGMSVCSAVLICLKWLTFPKAENAIQVWNIIC